ncbi:MAG: hypothetical protein CL462_05050 [Acidimicrobiaceae bacterium]|nr:hypothetical protein [Acidimicrobiaceae bacterium]
MFNITNELSEDKAARLFSLEICSSFDVLSFAMHERYCDPAIRKRKDAYSLGMPLTRRDTF